MLTPLKCKLTQLLYYCTCMALACSAARGQSFSPLCADEVALYIVDLSTRQVLWQHRADIPVQPASTMKLVTSFVALKTLGTDHRWQTQWYRHAPIIKGVLHGNLYWRGSGDPVLDQYQLQDIQRQLRLKGIYHIQGKLILDRQLWRNSGSAEGFDHDAEKAFMTAPDPHMLAYRLVWLTLLPPAGQSQPQFSTDPPLDNLHIINHTSWQNPSATTCHQLSQFVQAQLSDHQLTLTGQIPPDCAGQQLFVALHSFSAAEYAAHSFYSYWPHIRQQPHQLYEEKAVPAKSIRIFSHYSKPLADIVTDMNKYSNNIIARTLFLHLGESRPGDTIANAQAITQTVLQQAGIDSSTLQLENGSGLSQRERLSAHLLGQILIAAYQASFAATFINSLPIGGIDGTLSHRFTDSHGQWHLKTGTLAHVHAVAGYWLPHSPQQHPLAIVVIDNSATSSQDDLDAFVRTLPTHFSQPQRDNTKYTNQPPAATEQHPPR